MKARIFRRVQSIYLSTNQITKKSDEKIIRLSRLKRLYYVPIAMLNR